MFSYLFFSAQNACIDSIQSWNDFYETNKPAAVQYGNRIKKGVIITRGSEIYVKNCIFTISNSIEEGCAISITNSAEKFLVEGSSFISCKTSSKKGAILFESLGGQSVISEVCGYECISTSNDSDFLFASFTVRGNEKYNNTMIRSTVAKTVSEAENSAQPIGFVNGKITLAEDNITSSKVHIISIVWFQPTKYGSISHSTFTNNTGIIYMGIRFANNHAPKDIISSNIIKNVQLTDECGIIYSYGSCNIKDSVITKNEAPYVFCAQGGSMKCTNCVVDTPNNISGPVTFENSPAIPFKLNIDIDLFECLVDILNPTPCPKLTAQNRLNRYIHFIYLSCIILQ